MGNKAQSKERSSSSNSDGSDSLETTSEQPSYWQMAKQGYQELVNAIIRPPRCIYETKHLGPKVFDFCGKSFQRVDFELTNPRGLQFVCSMWEPLPSFRQNPILPCIIYMHGNSSARLESLAQLSLALSLGVVFLAFDFAGSGLSDGDYVSLGWYEKDDLQVVIEHLRSTGTISTIALWGRSMGAVTALLHGERDPSIAGMVLDSAFADLTMLAEEMVEKGRQNGLYAPNLVVRLAIRFIRSSVQKTAAFDIQDLSPIAYADKCFIPALFVAGEYDTFVAPHHSKKIHEKYAGDKNLIIVDGDHNSPRPKFMFDSAAIFLVQTLQIPEEWMLPDSTRFVNVLPWFANRSANGMKFTMNLEEDNIGMTKDRQADIQNKMYRMFGSQATSDGNKPTKMASMKAIGSEQLKSERALGHHSSGSTAGEEEESAMKPSGVDTPDDISENIISSFEEDPRGEEEQTEWTCSTCTLINQPVNESCIACGIPRYSDLYAF